MWPALVPSIGIARELESTEAACSTTTAPPTGPLPQIVKPHRIRWCPRKPFRPSRFCAYLEASLATGQLTNGGPLQRVLAERVQSWTGATHAVVLTANGTAALHALVSAHALMRKRRLRWATQAYTFPVSMQGPLADSVVLDLDAKHWGPCLAGLDSVKSDIDGVIVTNVFGYLADVGAYEAWTTMRYGANPLVEVGLLPLAHPRAFAAGQVPAHRKRRIRQVQCGAVIGLVRGLVFRHGIGRSLQ